LTRFQNGGIPRLTRHRTGERTPGQAIISQLPEFTQLAARSLARCAAISEVSFGSMNGAILQSASTSPTAHQRDTTWSVSITVSAGRPASHRLFTLPRSGTTGLSVLRKT
jgi:hypothetical protein